MGKPPIKGQENLKPNYSKWVNSETVAIRVPKVLKKRILEIARQLDKDINLITISESSLRTIADEIIKQKKSASTSIELLINKIK